MRAALPEGVMCVRHGKPAHRRSLSGPNNAGVAHDHPIQGTAGCNATSVASLPPCCCHLRPSSTTSPADTSRSCILKPLLDCRHTTATSSITTTVVIKSLAHANNRCCSCMDMCCHVLGPFIPFITTPDRLRRHSVCSFLPKHATALHTHRAQRQVKAAL